MFTLFKKKPKAAAAKSAQPPPQALDKIVSALKELQSQEVANAMQAAAEANERIVEENQQELERMQKDSPVTALLREKRLSLEDGLYILPGELQGYRDRIELLIRIFEVTSAAESYELGANEIDPLLLGYIAAFKQALMDGQKRKANACWNVLKYSVMVVHDKPLRGDTEEERRMSLERRKDIVDMTGKTVLDTVDNIYGCLFKLKSDEATYSKIHEEFIAAQKRLDAIPDEYKDIMESLGFDGVLEQYPSGHPMRSFVSEEITQRGRLAHIQAYQQSIENLQSRIKRLIEDLNTLENHINDSFNEDKSDPIVMNYDDLIKQLNAVSKPEQQEKAAGKRTKNAEKGCTLKDLIAQLRKLRKTSIMERMEQAAEENERILEANQAELERLQAEAPDSAPYLELLRLTDGLYLLPQDLQQYRDRIDLLIQIYESTSAAESDKLGANEIDSLISSYIEQFKQALMDGQKRRAEVCWDILKYSVMIAHDRPLSDMKSKRQKSLETRKILISTTANAALRSIDRIYGLFFQIPSNVDCYNKAHQEYGKDQERLNALPPQYLDTMNTLGFDGVIEQYPAGHPLRGFVHEELILRTKLVRMQSYMLTIETLHQAIVACYEVLSKLDRYLHNSFNEQGKDFDEQAAAEDFAELLAQLYDVLYPEAQRKKFSEEIQAILSNLKKQKEAPKREEKREEKSRPNAVEYVQHPSELAAFFKAMPAPAGSPEKQKEMPQREEKTSSPPVEKANHPSELEALFASLPVPESFSEKREGKPHFIPAEEANRPSELAAIFASMPTLAAFRLPHID